MENARREAMTAGTAEQEVIVDDRRIDIVDLRRHTARGVIINSLFQAGLVGVSALRGLVVAAFLTTTDYGVWGLVSITLWTAVGLKAVFGANDKYIQQADEDQEHAFQRAFTVELIFAAAVTPVAAGVVLGYAVLSGHSVVIAPGLILLLLLPSTALQFPLAVFYRRMDYRRQRLLSAIEPLGGAIVMVVLAILGAGYWSFVVGAVAGSCAGALVAIYASPFRLAIRYDRGALRQYVHFSTPLLISGLAALAMFQAITLIGVGIIGLAGIGAFTLVGNMVQFTDQAGQILSETLYPAVCAVRDRVAVVSEIFVKSNRLSLMWAVPFGVGLTLFGSDLIHLWLGKQWLPAVPLLEVMGIVTAVEHVGYNWSAFAKARGITWPIAVTAVTLAVVVVGTSVPLMHTFGLVGLGYAFVIGEVISVALRGIWLIRFFNGVSILSQLFRGFAPTIIAAMPILVLRAAAGNETGLPAALGMFALYVVLTIVATVALERPLLREAIGYLVRRTSKVSTTLPGQAKSPPLAPLAAERW
jgi:O-antigen/teichoic acid export membrane protein